MFINPFPSIIFQCEEIAKRAVMVSMSSHNKTPMITFVAHLNDQAVYHYTSLVYITSLCERIVTIYTAEKGSVKF